jgi:hypothetical protein
MDEIERRLAALELVLAELLAVAPAGRLTDVADLVRSDTSAAKDEQVVREALRVIEHAAKRHAEFHLGLLAGRSDRF